MGFEPTRTDVRQILSLLRLPFRHRPTQPVNCTREKSAEQAKEMLLENAAAFFLGWLLGAGLGPALWDSVLGVM